jgi:RNA polymerase sigma factor (sigma-70 family)
MEAGMIATRCEAADHELVDAVRAGDDAAFEELYTRYRPRIAAYVRGMLRDEARAEDVTQEAFFSALRRMRETDSEIAFKPWIYQIAHNAAIDSYRRSSRAEEVSMDADAGLRPSDHVRLVGAPPPDSVLIDRERFDHLRGAFDELSDVHTRVLVMRELEGLSYREIGERLDLTRPAVESTLFRARRRLESEYAELSEGRRCAAMRATIGRLAEGLGGERDERRLARHARRCSLCRRRARELGVEPLAAPAGLRAKVAALLPLPWGFPGGGQLGGLFAERAAALAVVAAMAGAGGAALQIEGGSGPPQRENAPEPPVVSERTLGAGPRAADARRDPSAGERSRRGDSTRPGQGRRPGQGTEAGQGATGQRRSATPTQGSGRPGAETGAPGSPDRAPGAPSGPALPPAPDLGGRVPQVPLDGAPTLPPAPPVSLPPLDGPPSVGGPPGVTVPDSVPPAVDGAGDPVTNTVGDATSTIPTVVP